MTNIKRQKHAKRTLTFYKSNFGFEVPYKILIDGTFCKQALAFKVNIMEQMPKYMDAQAILMTTVCAKAECEKYGSKLQLPLYGANKVISQYQVEQCGHDVPVSPSDCLVRMARKKNHYFIATQDKALSERLRQIPGVPLLYMAHNSINLEPPSALSLKRANDNLQEKLSRTEKLVELKKALNVEAPLAAPKKKRKGPKGPNPLSCLRKKAKPKNSEDSSEGMKKKKRNRNRKKSNKSADITDAAAA